MSKQDKKRRKVIILHMLINIIFITTSLYLGIDTFKTFYAINGVILTPLATMYLCEFLIK